MTVPPDAFPDDDTPADDLGRQLEAAVDKLLHDHGVLAPGEHLACYFLVVDTVRWDRDGSECHGWHRVSSPGVRHGQLIRMLRRALERLGLTSV